MKPKKTAYRKTFKGGKTKGRQEAKNLTRLNLGQYGLVSREYARISARQIESARRCLRHHRFRVGKVWVNAFTDTPVTKKPREVRMGNGKGNVEYWSTNVRPGTVRYEVSGVDQKQGRNALQKASQKLAIRTKVVIRETI